MHLLKPFLCTLLIAGIPLFCTAGTPSATSNLADNVQQLDPATAKLRFSKLDPHFKIFRDYQYHEGDKTIDLLLLETQDKPHGEYQLSSRLQAQLIETDATQQQKVIQTIRDMTQDGEAGVQFWSKQVELKDLDGDGHIDPVLVYRFYTYDDDQNINDDPFQGRLKMVVFHRGTKAVIRAVSGEFDDERSTIATPTYIQLPNVIKKHLVSKMESMYQDQIFGFDNSYRFVPQPEK